MKIISNPYLRISCMALFGATIIPAAANPLQWDGNAGTTGISDATSAWNTANNWWNGTTNVSWSDNSDVQFGTGTLGNAGSVTISGTNPTVNSITFNTPFGTGNFNITGGTVNLLNTSTDITVNGGTPTISSALAGTDKGINKKGNGELRLGGTVSYTGATTITGGTLRVNSGANSLYTSTSGFSMAGGSLVVFAGAIQNIAKDFTFSSASGTITTFDSSANIGHTLSGTMNINSGATMTLRPRNAGLNFIVSGKITGAGNFAVANNSGDVATAAIRISNTDNDYAGSTTISGGILQLGASNVIPNASNLTMSLAGSLKPTLDLNGFNETIGSLASTATTADIFNNSGSGTSVLSVGANNASASFAGSIKDNDGVATGGTVALTKLGSGTQTLTGDSTYTGATNVNAGTLVVNGNISTSNFTVADGATISGSGTVGALTIQSGGFVNAGNSPGILNTGNYSQAGTLVAEITGLTAGTQHDQINVTGTVTLSGALDLQFSASPDYVLNSMIFLILNDGVDAVSGTFSGLAQGATAASFGGFDWIISYEANSSGSSFTGGNDVALRAIPEPSTALLGGLGVLALLRRRRR
jgi:autotransporter-associated beta strand protein